MFLDNKYTKTYYKIINRASSRILEGYVENHHIIPRCLKGDDTTVKLTAREHLLCHLLLTKMVSGEAKYKMHWALNLMMTGSKIYHPGRSKSNSRAYSQARLEFIKYLKRPKSEEHKAKISKANMGHSVSQETREKTANKNRGKVRTEEQKVKMSLARKGKSKNESTKKNMSQARKLLMQSALGIELKKKISATHKGKISTLKGVPKSAETRKKMSEASRDYMQSEDWKQSHANAMKKRIGMKFITDGIQNRLVTTEEAENISAPWKNGITRNTKSQRSFIGPDSLPALKASSA